jgi:hypothetical protein
MRSPRWHSGCESLALCKKNVRRIGKAGFKTQSVVKCLVDERTCPRADVAAVAPLPCALWICSALQLKHMKIAL